MVSVDKLSGKCVFCAGGFNLGEVKGAEIDTTTWKVTHLQVKLSNQASEDLGFKKRFRTLTVCMPVSLVSAIGDAIIVNKTLNELSKNPEISECPE